MRRQRAVLSRARRRLAVRLRPQSTPSRPQTPPVSHP
jgi:hypothetical protein